MKATRVPIADRLHAKLETMPNGCIEFMGARSNGYGAIGRSTEEGRGYAHRVAWEVTFGPIPDGMFVCHHCDNRPCCNPDHLFLGTPADNMRDMIEKGRASTPTHRYGEQHHFAVESDEMVRTCRVEYAAGMGAQEIAIKHGLKRDLIWRWVTGKHRRDAGGPLPAA